MHPVAFIRQAGAYCVTVTQGPLVVGDAIAEQVRKYRLQRGWSVRQLAEECAKHGAPQLTTASLGNIERGQDANAKRGRREVTAEELLILAVVLRTPPVLLLCPIDRVIEMEVIPGDRLPPWLVAKWVSGLSAYPAVSEEAEREWKRDTEHLYRLQAHDYAVDLYLETRSHAQAYREAAKDASDRGEADEAEAYQRALRSLDEGALASSKRIVKIRRTIRRSGLPLPDLPPELSSLDKRSQLSSPEEVWIEDDAELTELRRLGAPSSDDGKHFLVTEQKEAT
jgi:transcriptional regulator with XRE-family HTH domain